MPSSSAWISDYVSQAHETLVAEPIGDYAQYLDVDSFVNMLVLNELTKGGDKYVRSVYVYKDRDGLINAGPAWDYNFTLGNLVNELEGWQIEGGRDYGANILSDADSKRASTDSPPPSSTRAHAISSAGP